MASRNRPDLAKQLRLMAVIAVPVGAAVSLALMYGAARPPLLLLILFTGWVLSPFVGVALVDLTAKRWPGAMRATLSIVALVITFGSFAFYSGIVPMPADSRPAAVYLLVPLGSWVLLAATWLIGRTRAS